MSAKLTIIGAGSTGFAAAAYFTLRGHKVTLFDCERFQPVLEDINRQNGILLRGYAGAVGLAMPDQVTTDIAQAMDGAKLICVCVPAQRHPEIAELCAPYGQAGQNYLISPGNLGSVLYKREFEKRGTAQGVVFAELAGNIFPCRLTGPAEALVAVPFPPKKAAAFPACDTPKLIEAFQDVMPITPLDSIIEAALNSHNVILHLSMSILNATQIEQKGKAFAIFRDGVTPGTIELAQAVENERTAIMDLLGYRAFGSAAAHLRNVSRYGEFPELDAFRSLDGPDSLHHRYIVEDGLAGVALMVSIGAEYGVPTPLSEALLKIATVISGVDFMAEGRTLHNLGISGYTPEQLLQLLRQGA